MGGGWVAKIWFKIVLIFRGFSHTYFHIFSIEGHRGEIIIKATLFWVKELVSKVVRFLYTVFWNISRIRTIYDTINDKKIRIILSDFCVWMSVIIDKDEGN